MSGGEGDKILVRALETCSVSSKLSSSSTSGDNRLPAFKDARSRDASKNWEIHGTTCTGPHSKTFFSVDLDICNGQSKLLISLWAPLYPPSRTCILFKRGQEQAVSYRTIRILATTSSSSFARSLDFPWTLDLNRLIGAVQLFYFHTSTQLHVTTSCSRDKEAAPGGDVLVHLGGDKHRKESGKLSCTVHQELTVVLSSVQILRKMAENRSNRQGDAFLFSGIFPFLWIRGL
ncbi:uncharacterized protein LOC133492023 isoform X5 [Syngnathoides biaculeatus]|uniref:uncharacterized protein LOC133492023 isoform X5 n=1 Tax=Syngnathoides biaculeatus TaxID=300417 RepID=UPI002ADD9394|nr:uncharacterized protein LOC133492023 isoform X5 [Syngnathoides biaculeatus]